MHEYNSYLVHHGVKGQKWGVRRFQNPDGSLTAEGKKRYSEIELDARKLSKSTAIMVQSHKNAINKISKTGKELDKEDKVAIQRDVSSSLRNKYLKDLNKKYGSNNVITGFINESNRTRIEQITNNKFDIEKGKEYTYALIMDKESGLNNMTVSEIRNYINK